MLLILCTFFFVAAIVLVPPPLPPPSSPSSAPLPRPHPRSASLPSSLLQHFFPVSCPVSGGDNYCYSRRLSLPRRGIPRFLVERGGGGSVGEEEEDWKIEELNICGECLCLFVSRMHACLFCLSGSHHGVGGMEMLVYSSLPYVYSPPLLFPSPLSTFVLFRSRNCFLRQLGISRTGWRCSE